MHTIAGAPCRATRVATRVAADFLDFIAFCRCSTGVALHPLNILVSHLPPRTHCAAKWGGFQLRNPLLLIWGLFTWGLSNGGLRPLSATRAQAFVIVHICGLLGPFWGTANHTPSPQKTFLIRWYFWGSGVRIVGT